MKFFLDVKKRWLVEGSLMLVFAVWQHFYIRRAGHYLPSFDIVDGIFFGTAFSSLAIWVLRSRHK